MGTRDAVHVLPFQWYIAVGHTRPGPLPVHGCCGPTIQAFAGDRTATSSGYTPGGSRMARQLVPSQRIAFARPRKNTAVVMGKPDRLARAINAIIDNAISFSPPGGLVEIAAAHVGDEIRIRVDDEGPGVPPEARQAIFNRFHSVRPEGESFGRHSGLGLAIAQAIVKGHDGEIDVHDRDDAPSGARFTIRLPAADRE